MENWDLQVHRQGLFIISAELHLEENKKIIVLYTSIGTIVYPGEIIFLSNTKAR